MGWLRKSTDVAGRTDAVASWGERATKLVLWVVGPSALSALAVGAYAWITANPLYGVLFGLIAFAIVQLALMLRAIRRSAARRGPFAEPEPERAIAPVSSQTDLEDSGQLRAQLEEAKQENERLRIELNNRPPRHFNTPVEVIETLTPAKAKEIEELKAENERLRNQPEGEGLRRDWLKRECRDMAAYLRWFLKDHGHETEDQIVDLYRERYQDKVAVLLQQLERQDLYPPEDRKSFQVAADKFPRSPMAIRNLAGTLGSIGQEI